MKLKRISLLALTLILAIAVVVFVSSCDKTGAAIEGVTFTDASFNYDGEAKTIEVAGSLPEGAEVTYYPTNSYTEIGVYTIEATVSAKGYEDLVLVAKLTILDETIKPDVTVTFDTAGGPALSTASVTVPYGTAIEAPVASMYRNGYTFIGWYNENEKWSFTSPVTESMTLKAGWQLTQFTVTYHIGVGGATHANTLYTYTIDTEDYTLAPATAAVGGQFNGWYVIENGTPVTLTKITKGTVGNLDIYADFTYPSFDVTYVLGAETAVNASQNPTFSNIGTDAQLLYEPVAEGFKFLGWYTTATFEESSRITHVPASLQEPITLYAKWNPTVYEIVYENVTGAETPDVTTFTANDEITLQPANARKGYDFAGWVNEKGELVTKIEKGTAKNVTLSATWTIATYTITYDANGATGTVTNPATYTINTPDFTLLIPTKTNYTFLGWFDASGNSYETIATGSYGNLALTAQWAPNSFSIIYNNLNGATNAHTNPATFTVLDEVTLAPAAKTGYVFDGWFDNAELTGAPVTKIAAGTLNHVVLYAKFTPAELSVTYVLNGGVNSIENPHGFSAAGAPVALKGATKAGYTFAGWYTDASFTSAPVTEVSGTESITLYAKFLPGTAGLVYTPVCAAGSETVIGYAVSGYTGTETRVVIPATHDGKNVIAIKSTAFANNTTVTEIVVAATVTTVEADAFLGCTALTAINCRIANAPEGYAENWNRASGDSEATSVYHATVFGYSEEADLILPEQPI